MAQNGGHSALGDFELKEQEFLIVNRRKLFLFGSAGALAVLLPNQSFASEPAGSVAELVGSATAASDGKARALALKEPVLIGDLVKTEAEARLALLLGLRTTLRLGAQTELRIDGYVVDAGGEIEFRQGAIQFDRKGGASSGNLRFKSPYGLIAVRGTSFIAGPSRGGFGVFVTRGKVAVTGGERTVVLDPGLGTNIATPGASPTQPSTWSIGRISQLEAQLR